MSYCPKCRAEVPAHAHFCVHCGYRPASPEAPQEQPHTPPVVPSLPSVSVRSIQPAVKHVPHRPKLVNNIPPESKIATGTNDAALPAHSQAQPKQQSSTPARSTPAHHLALAPVTWPGMPTFPAPEQSRVLHGPQSQEFQPNFMPAKEKERQLQPLEVREQLAQLAQSGYIPSWPGQTPYLPPPQPPVPPGPPQLQPQPPIEHQPTRQTPSIEVVKGGPQLIDSYETFDNIDEGFIFTSQAAEHWRTSWRDRQRSEAGPATIVSRGQSLVPEPLMAMQHSLMRIRAIVMPQRMHQKQHNAALTFWIALFLLIGLILGLASFIAYSYLPRTDSAPRLDAPVAAPQPSLRLQGTPLATIVQGQELHVHGDNFNAGAPIIFLLDGTTTINDTTGRQLAVVSSDQGSFDVVVPTSTWSVGTHVILAQDNKDGESAYLTMEVDLKASGDTASADVALSVFPRLIFEAISGQGNPPQKVITLTNKNATTPLTWTATATVKDNLSWLIIDPATTSGNIAVGGKATVDVGVEIAGLKSSPQPYTGSIVFTINKTEQMVLPVELQVRDTAAEIVISPNPLVGVLDASGKACQANSQLLLVNISNTAVSWSINLNDTSKQHIQFTHGGEPAMQGQLAPAGQQGDTEVLTLQCIQVHNEQVYSFTVVANNVAWPETLLIQQS